MKNRLHLILISLVMLALLLPTGLAFAQDDEAVLLIEVTDYPRLVFDGDLVPVAVTITHSVDDL